MLGPYKCPALQMPRSSLEYPIILYRPRPPKSPYFASCDPTHPPWIHCIYFYKWL